MRIIIAFILCFIFSDILSQTTSSNIRYKSSISKLETREDSLSEWVGKEYSVDHLIIIRLPEKKVLIYADEKESDLDIISPVTKLTRKSVEEYNFKCIDQDVNECNVTVSYLRKKVLFIKVEYSLYRVFYFISQ